MKEYMVLDVWKSNAEKAMNDMAKGGVGSSCCNILV